MAIRTETTEAINIIGQEDFTELAPGVYQLEDGQVFIQDQDGETGLLIEGK